MLMCSRCKKRPAVVFISQMNAKDPQHKKNEGLCLVCAKELGISQVDDYMKAMGISDDDLEAMSNQLMEASDGDDFEPGGTNFLSNLFGGDAANLFSNLAGGMPKATDEGGENKPKDKKKKLKFLNNYCTNLTQKAREGKLDNVVGRDKEISRVIHILSRRQKNNPCLIGEPGVGKTAIAEGIAQRIVGGDVPFHIKDKELYLLDLTALVAGTQFRGQFESRCKGLVEEVKEQGNVILFIDEVHTLVGTGDNEGTMNAANILKPSLSRGWGVVTPEEAAAKIEEQRQEIKGEPKNLEEQAISLVGRDIYEKLIKGYTEKQWGRPCNELPSFIIKRLPVRLTFDNNYFNALYQGIPMGGYTKMVENMLEGIEVRLNTDYLENKEELDSLADKVVYTGPIDAYFNYKLGTLEYRSVRFETEVLDKPNFQGNAAVNYTDAETPWTRIIEHKWFEFGTQPKTVISREYSSEWKLGDEPYYPVNDEKNGALYAEYKKLGEAETKVIFGGRLGEYNYKIKRQGTKSPVFFTYENCKAILGEQNAGFYKKNNTIFIQKEL